MSAAEPSHKAAGPVRRWLHASLALGPWPMRLLWAIPAAILLGLLSIAMVLPVDAPDPAAGDALGSVSTPKAALLPTPAEGSAIAELQIARDPLAPALPPVLALRTPAAEYLLGVKGDPSRFNGVLRDLAVLEPTCAAAPDLARLATVNDALNHAVSHNALKSALVAYHQGVLDLCAGDFGPARQSFDTALKQTPASTVLTSAGRARWLAQFRMMANYGRGLALLGGGRDGSKPTDAEQALSAAHGLEDAATAEARAGPLVDFSADNGDLFNVSSAEIDNAQIVAHARSGDFSGAMKAGGAAGSAPSLVIAHPSLAANLAVVAAAENNQPAVIAIYHALRGALGAQPSDSHWTQADKPALIRILAMAATTNEPIYTDADKGWWPVGSDEPSRTRAAFETTYGRGPLWFPELDLGKDDQRWLDVWLWLRRDRDDLAHDRLADFERARQPERRLPAGDQTLLERARGQAVQRLGDAWMQHAEAVRRRDGMVSARPVFQLLASRGFPAWVAAPARLSLFTGQPAGLIEGGIALLFILLAVGFVLHRELRLGYQRTFPHRHYDQRITSADKGRPDV